MKLVINKIANANIVSDSLSVKVTVTGKDFEKSHFKAAPALLFCLGSKEIACKFVSITESKEVSILLSFPRSFGTLCDLYPYIAAGIDLHSCYLLVEETVEISLYAETHQLLEEYATQSGRPSEGILQELTAFKTWTGAKDLRYVKEKQMLIVKDKLKKLLQAVCKDPFVQHEATMSGRT